MEWGAAAYFSDFIERQVTFSRVGHPETQQILCHRDTLDPAYLGIDYAACYLANYGNSKITSSVPQC